MNEQPITPRAEDLWPGRKVRKTRDDGQTETWTAGGQADRSRWLHESGQRTVSDAAVQRWLDGGRAEVLFA